MAVSFINHQTGNKFLIGGQASLAGADSGHAGTMPTYDITREEITLGDKTHLGFRYNITITGVATNGRNDIKTTKGEAQGEVMDLARKGLADLNNPNTKNYGVGKLEIAPYGGFGDIISFNDARLVSVEMAEQDEETSGTQYQNYTYTFEAYKNNSSGGEQEEITFLLKEASESWSLSESGEFTYDDMKIHDETNKYKVYTLTHEVRATGYRKYENTQIDPESGHPWKQAVKWVANRLSVTENLGNIAEDLTGNSDSNEFTTQFNAGLMNAAGDTKLINLITNGYQPRNKTRSIQSDIAGGSYSVSETYSLVKGSATAFVSVETSVQLSQEAEQPVQTTVSGKIIGLSSNDFGTKTSSDKYTNALTAYSKLFNNTSGGSASEIKNTILFEVADQSYGRVGTDIGYLTGQLYEKSAIGFEESHDKINGTIDFSVIFSDAEEIIDGCYSCKTNVSYTNHGGSGRKPSPIAVVANGPYIYIPETTDEKTATFTVELKMLKNKRTNKPDGETAIRDRAGRMTYTRHAPRISSRSESWNPSTGVYTLSLVYTYV